MARALASSFIEVYKVASNDVSNITSSFSAKHKDDSNGNTSTASTQPLNNAFDAVKNGDLDVVAQFVNCEGAHLLDDHGHTLAHWAALLGHRDILLYLIDQGAPINTASQHKMGQYPIHWACVNNHRHIVDLLLQMGASIDQKDAAGATPLLVAAQYGSLNTCAILMFRGADIHSRDNEGDTALHWAAFGGFADLCRLLVYSGLTPQDVDGFGQTPLHLACISGNLRTVKEFCHVDKVNHSLIDKNGRTPRDLAIGRNYDRIVNFLSGLGPRKLPKCDFASIVFGPTGTQFPIIFFVFSIVFWGYPMYIYKGIWLTWTTHFPLHVLFISLNVIMWFSLYHANENDPGYLPRNTREYDDALKQMVRPPTSQYSAENEMDSLNRLCHSCRTVRPQRTSHCRYCGRCVKGLDHHCPYINNCVGVNNRHSFLIFVTTVFFLGLVSLKLVYVVWAIEEYVFQWDYVIGLFLLKIFGLLVSYINITAWHNAIVNLTTNEKMRWKHYRYLQDRQGRFKNPYNVGVIGNLMYHFHLAKINLSDNNNAFVQPTIFNC